jgi:predicted acylesterase/phospholipase RssA
LAGGGTAGLVAFGALQTTEKAGHWSRDDLCSIDATSAGTLLAVLIALRFDWTDAEVYLVKRPWHQVLKSDLYSLLGAFDQRGIWTIDVMEQVLAPLLLAKNLDKTVTLLEFFQHTQLDVHYYAVGMKRQCELVDISHTTHPTWTVVEAVYASASVPILFAPLFKDGVGYVDGGMLLNYPLRMCLQRPDVDPEAVFGVKRSFEWVDPVQPTSNLFKYVLYLINQLIFLSREKAVCAAAAELVITSETVMSMDLLQLCSSELLRRTLVDEGIEHATRWLAESSLQNS